MQILDESITTENILNNKEIIMIVQADMALKQDLDLGDTNENEILLLPLISLQ